MKETKKMDSWDSRLGIIMAVAGSAVGWRNRHIRSAEKELKIN
ncbi:MAG: hypothetical protein AABY43_00750 [Candidatus Omnitrophota bacterium]